MPPPDDSAYFFSHPGNTGFGFLLAEALAQIYTYCMIQGNWSRGV